MTPDRVASKHQLHYDRITGAPEHQNVQQLMLRVQYFPIIGDIQHCFPPGAHVAPLYVSVIFFLSPIFSLLIRLTSYTVQSVRYVSKTKTKITADDTSSFAFRLREETGFVYLGTFFTRDSDIFTAKDTFLEAGKGEA